MMVQETDSIFKITMGMPLTEAGIGKRPGLAQLEVLNASEPASARYLAGEQLP